MSIRTKYLICLFLIIGTIAVLFFLPQIPQNPSYHLFADGNNYFKTPNFWNVISNAPFILIALIGFMLLFKKNRKGISIHFVLITGIFLTGLGSAYYHLQPTNQSLVWDRIPMTIVFMSLLSYVISICIGKSFANWMLPPLLLIGIASVLYWQQTEAIGKGDLRFYGWVQFFPMIMIPTLLILFKTSSISKRELFLIILFYIVAKLFEHFDQFVFEKTKLISGHSLKHVFAAISTWHIIKMINAEPKSKNELVSSKNF